MVVGENFLRFLDSLAVEENRLVCDRFHFACEDRERFKVAVDGVTCFAVLGEDRFELFFFRRAER